MSDSTYPDGESPRFGGTAILPFPIFALLRCHLRSWTIAHTIVTVLLAAYAVQAESLPPGYPTLLIGQIAVLALYVGIWRRGHKQLSAVAALANARHRRPDRP